MNDFRGRLFEEYDQLTQRIEKLKTFIISEKYDALTDIDIILLFLLMLHDYIGILSLLHLLFGSISLTYVIYITLFYL